MTVREELAGYIALQRLLDRKTALEREIETPPAELVALREAFDARREALGDKQSRREALAAEQEALQVEGEALREEREHFRKQKSMVTNMKQLQAVVSELDHVDSQIKAKEDRLLEILAEIEGLDRDLASLREETPEEKAEREKAEAAWEQRRETAGADLQEIKRGLRAIRDRIGDKSWERFRKLWNSRRPNAVVPLEGWSCSFCHAELRPSLIQAVRSVEALQTCDSCRRLLYDPEQFGPDVV